MLQRNSILHYAAVFAGVAIVASVAVPSLAQKPFLDRVKALYSLDKNIGNCRLCHTFNSDKGEAPHDENLNKYGDAIRLSKSMDGLRKKGDEYKFKPEELDRFVEAVKSVEGADTDGDGATNKEELALGTLPADEKSTPEKDALEKYRKEKK
jgi:hypothetical protein